MAQSAGASEEEARPELSALHAGTRFPLWHGLQQISTAPDPALPSTAGAGNSSTAMMEMLGSYLQQAVTCHYKVS
jgi:hypothetical protein